VNQISRRGLLGGIAGAVAAKPSPAQKASAVRYAKDNRLNVIFVVFDTWSTHWMGCYGGEVAWTPSVDALAAKSAVFVDAYPENLYTPPARRSIYTGRQTFPSERWQMWNLPVQRGWHPLFVEDVTLSEKLLDVNWTTALVSDLGHSFQPGFNYHRGFKSWRWVRGQEVDQFETGPTKGINPRDFLHESQKTIPAAGLFMLYLVSRQFRRTEDDWAVAQTFDQASSWLERNVEDNQPFYLHVESYSPHEYWDPPDEYYRLYMKSNYDGPRLIQAPDSTSVLTPVELEHVRALYSGLVTFTDLRFGRFLAKIEQLGLMENTIIVVTSDHGGLLGEQGVIHKSEGTLRTQVTNVPLIVYYPLENLGGRRVKGFVQHIDIVPTILELLGAEIPSRVTGQSFKEALWSGTASKRDSIITGAGNFGSIRTPEFNYIGRWNAGPNAEQVYDLKKDPLELTNIVSSQSSLAAACRQKLTSYVEESWQITRGNLSRNMETAT